MNKTKTAQPISVEYKPVWADKNGCYMAKSSVVLTVRGDCVSKVYEGKNIESLNPPVAFWGLFQSVKYCPETDTSEIVYIFDASSCINYRKAGKRFALKMQARINAQKIKEFKAQLKQERDENIK